MADVRHFEPFRNIPKAFSRSNKNDRFASSSNLVERNLIKPGFSFVDMLHQITF